MMKKSENPALLQMGCVSLNVRDLKSVSGFYEAAGLSILKQEKEGIVLGHRDKEMLSLFKTSLPESSPEGAGLYHVAIVHGSQSELAKCIRNLFERFPDSFSGPADHLVSEAFYFQDPEGNGLELYYDRPKSEWQWENKKIVMATNHLDPISFMEQHTNGKGSDEKRIGHIHLKVGDIAKAKEFYVGVLGFDITADSWPGALFISKDGYHHHIGLNVWHSKGADKRKEELGLLAFEITPSSAHFETIVHNLDQKNVKYGDIKDGIAVHDPWSNKILIRTERKNARSEHR